MWNRAHYSSRGRVCWSHWIRSQQPSGCLLPAVSHFPKHNSLFFLCAAAMADVETGKRGRLTHTVQSSSIKRGCFALLAEFQGCLKAIWKYSPGMNFKKILTDWWIISQEDKTPLSVKKSGNFTVLLTLTCSVLKCCIPFNQFKSSQMETY